MTGVTLDEFITPDEVCQIIPGMTKGKLAQLRLVSGRGPRFYKPTDRTVIYKRSEVLAWVEGTSMVSTVEARSR